MRRSFSSRLMNGFLVWAFLAAGLLRSSTSVALAVPRDVFNPYETSGDQKQDAAADAPLSDETAAAMKQVIQTLKRAALAEEPEVCMAALRTLPRFVSQDDEIIDLLWNAAQSDNIEIKRTAAWALVCCDESTGKFIDGLLQLAGDESLDQNTRDNVIERLKYIGPKAVVPRAVDAVQSGQLATQLQAVKLLVAFQEGSQPAIELLLQTGMNADADLKLRARALSAAGQIMDSVAAYERAKHEVDGRATAAAEKLLAAWDANGDRQLTNDGRDAANVRENPQFDTNHDGVITFDEIKAVYLRQYLERNQTNNNRSSAYPLPENRAGGRAFVPTPPPSNNAASNNAGDGGQ